MLCALPPWSIRSINGEAYRYARRALSSIVVGEPPCRLSPTVLLECLLTVLGPRVGTDIRSFDRRTAAASVLSGALGSPWECASAGPFRILIVHEQHLQSMGSDTRLMGIIKGLLAAGQEVSLFFRSHTPQEARSPPSADVAERK